jgi:hypothetical protein
MTTGEHFQTVLNRVKYGAVTIGFAEVVWLIWRYPHPTTLQIAEFGLLGAIPLIVIIWALTYRRFLCPRCGADLGALNREQIRATRRELGWGKSDMRLAWERWDACPRCSSRFDDPY